MCVYIYIYTHTYIYIYIYISLSLSLSLFEHYCLPLRGDTAARPTFLGILVLHRVCVRKSATFVAGGKPAIYVFGVVEPSWPALGVS